MVDDHGCEARLNGVGECSSDTVEGEPRGNVAKELSKLSKVTTNYLSI